MKLHYAIIALTLLGSCSRRQRSCTTAAESISQRAPLLTGGTFAYRYFMTEENALDKVTSDDTSSSLVSKCTAQFQFYFDGSYKVKVWTHRACVRYNHLIHEVQLQVDTKRPGEYSLVPLRIRPEQLVRGSAPTQPSRLRVVADGLLQAVEAKEINKDAAVHFYRLFKRDIPTSNKFTCNDSADQNCVNPLELIVQTYELDTTKRAANPDFAQWLETHAGNLELSSVSEKEWRLAHENLEAQIDKQNEANVLAYLSNCRQDQQCLSLANSPTLKRILLGEETVISKEARTLVGVDFTKGAAVLAALNPADPQKAVHTVPGAAADVVSRYYAFVHPNRQNANGHSWRIHTNLGKNEFVVANAGSEQTKAVAFSSRGGHHLYSYNKVAAADLNQSHHFGSLFSLDGSTPVAALRFLVDESGATAVTPMPTRTSGKPASGDGSQVSTPSEKTSTANVDGCR